MRHFLAYALIAVGVLSLLLAVIAAAATAVSLNERMMAGPGLMFADVEILAMLTFFLGAVGLALPWLGRRLNRRTGPDNLP